MTAALQAQPTQLTELRAQFLEKCGRLKVQKLVESTQGNLPSELIFDLLLEGELGAQNAKIMVEVRAFGALISAVSFE
jgi:hypothetical protein